MLVGICHIPKVFSYFRILKRSEGQTNKIFAPLVLRLLIIITKISIFIPYTVCSPPNVYVCMCLFVTLWTCMWPPCCLVPDVPLSSSQLSVQLTWKCLVWCRCMMDGLSVCKAIIKRWYEGQRVRVHVGTVWNSTTTCTLYVSILRCLSSTVHFYTPTLAPIFLVKQNMFYHTYWLVCQCLVAPGPTAGEHSHPSMFAVVHRRS